MSTPIEFRVLGPVEFVGLESAAADALLVQPKRLAVLAYLTLARPGDRRSRESVISLFWPESGRERGRGALRGAVHFLRRHLGDGAIRSRGDWLMVQAGLLRCDASGFEAELSAGRPDRALGLYRGELLSGLPMAGLPRVEQWLEDTRVAFRRRAADACWSVAAAAEERMQWVTAADNARRAVSLSGYEEASVRRLLMLLDRAGDRVAAIREHESIAARWEREYGLRPSPETERLVESLRAGKPTASPDDSPHALAVARPMATVAVGRAARWSERQPRIAVLPFVRAGPAAAEEHVTAGLAQGIIAALSRVSNVRVIARTSVDRYSERATMGSVRPIAERLGVDAVLDGSLSSSGGRLTIAARLVDARSDAPIWSRVYHGEASELLSVQREVVLSVLEVLDIGVTAQERARLERLPTSHAEAYALYLEGRFRWNLRSERDIDAAIALFQHAIELDPGFAPAFAGLADAYLLLLPSAAVRVAEARTRARQAARAALALDPSLGEAWATLAMTRSVLGGEWYEAEADFRRAIELSPGHATAHHWWGSYLTFVLRRFEEGARELDLARELDPLSPIIRCDAALALLHRGRARDAIRTLEEALELDPTFWRGHYDLGVTTVLYGDPETGVRHLEQAWSMGGYGADIDRSTSNRAEATEWRGVFERKLVELERRPPHQGTRGFESALLSMLLGRHDVALEWLRVAHVEGSWGVVMQYFPAFEPLVDRAEFVALLEEAGLYEWRGRAGDPRQESKNVHR